MVTPAEAARRVAGRVRHRLRSLPILALNVHTACNCRCVMCDIWTANAQKREIGADELARHIDGIRRLNVQRVMLTGGEPLLHQNLWRLCEGLRREGIRITLVTTGLLIAHHVAEIAALVDDLVVSIDGAAEVHDAVRRTRGGFERIERGIALLNNYATRPRTTARSVVQRINHAKLVQTVTAIHATGVDCLSFLAADVSSTAFNRPTPWSHDRRAEVALSRDQLATLAAAIYEVEARCREPLAQGFVVGGVASLWRIYDYYSAIAGVGEFPPTKCNAPWVSAVMEPGGGLRPCFFHPPYHSDPALSVDEAVNAPNAVAFRRQLKVSDNEICKRCVCTLSLPPWQRA
jgi:MoaA/NifB/PqqE/SkfB family radical SAM enzyme